MVAKGRTLFEFHGTFIELRAHEGAADTARQLREDFGFFVAKIESEPHVVIHLHCDFTRCPRRKAKRIFRTRMCTVYGWGQERWIDYGVQGWARSVAARGHQPREIEVHGSAPGALYEFAYSALLSASGEALDRKGFHRVHALAIRRGSRSAVIVLPQGGGKSALAALLFRHSGAKIFSDEIPLLRRGVLHPFPLRMALKREVARAVGLNEADGRPFPRKIFATKLLFPIPESATAAPAKPDLVLIGRPARGQPRIRRASPLNAALGLLPPMVVGLGVPQMAEYMLRAESLSAIARIGISRLKGAFQVAFGAETAIFEYGKDALLNARVLEEFLDSAQSVGHNHKPDGDESGRKRPDSDRV